MSTCVHNFQPLGSGGYYKSAGNKNELGLTVYDQTKSYQMLYCPHCGETKEVVVRDYTK